MADALVPVQDTGDNVVAPPPEDDTAVAEQTSVENNQSDGSVDWSAQAQGPREPDFLDMSLNDPLAQPNLLGDVKLNSNTAANQTDASQGSQNKPAAPNPLSRAERKTMEAATSDRMNVTDPAGAGAALPSNATGAVAALDAAQQRTKPRR